MDGRRMATADAAWLHMDRPTNLMVVHCVFWFDRPLDWDAAFRDRVVPSFPPFSERVVDAPVTMGAIGPCRERVRDFSVSDHLHRVRLPTPGGDAEFPTYASAQSRMYRAMTRPRAADRWHRNPGRRSTLC